MSKYYLRLEKGNLDRFTVGKVYRSVDDKYITDDNGKYTKGSLNYKKYWGECKYIKTIILMGKPYRLFENIDSGMQFYTDPESKMTNDKIPPLPKKPKMKKDTHYIRKTGHIFFNKDRVYTEQEIKGSAPNIVFPSENWAECWYVKQIPVGFDTILIWNKKSEFNGHNKIPFFTDNDYKGIKEDKRFYFYAGDDLSKTHRFNVFCIDIDNRYYHNEEYHIANIDNENWRECKIIAIYDNNTIHWNCSRNGISFITDMDFKIQDEYKKYFIKSRENDDSISVVHDLDVNCLYDNKMNIGHYNQVYNHHDDSNITECNKNQQVKILRNLMDSVIPLADYETHIHTQPYVIPKNTYACAKHAHDPIDSTNLKNEENIMRVRKIISIKHDNGSETLTNKMSSEEIFNAIEIEKKKLNRIDSMELKSPVIDKLKELHKSNIALLLEAVEQQLEKTLEDL